MVHESRYGLATNMTKDSVVEQLVVAIHDTVREVTMITVQTSEAGDTVKLFQVTERDRISNRDRARENHEKMVVQTDTVFIERRDSVLVKNGKKARASPFEKTLKWVFWIIIALIGLKICPFFWRK